MRRKMEKYVHLKYQAISLKHLNVYIIILDKKHFHINVIYHYFCLAAVIPTIMTQWLNPL